MNGQSFITAAILAAYMASTRFLSTFLRLLQMTVFYLLNSDALGSSISAYSQSQDFDAGQS